MATCSSNTSSFSSKLSPTLYSGKISEPISKLSQSMPYKPTASKDWSWSDSEQEDTKPKRECERKRKIIQKSSYRGNTPPTSSVRNQSRYKSASLRTNGSVTNIDGKNRDPMHHKDSVVGNATTGRKPMKHTSKGQTTPLKSSKNDSTPSVPIHRPKPVVPKYILEELDDIEQRLKQDPLPILSLRDDIISSLARPEASLLVTAATGSGKSTTVPAILVIASVLGKLPCGNNKAPRWIFLTQPRAFAARNIVFGLNRYLGNTQARAVFWPEAEVLIRARSAFGTPYWVRTTENTEEEKKAQVERKEYGGRKPRRNDIGHEVGQGYMPRVVALTEEALMRIVGEYLGLPSGIVVILDEAHERTPEMDCLISILGRMGNDEISTDTESEREMRDKNETISRDKRKKGTSQEKSTPIKTGERKYKNIRHQHGKNITTEIENNDNNEKHVRVWKTPFTRVIIMSATVDPNFCQHFMPSMKALSCQVRSHTIQCKHIYAEESHPGLTATSIAVDLAMKHLSTLGNHSYTNETAGTALGTTLVFLPGRADCLDGCRMFENRLAQIYTYNFRPIKPKCNINASVAEWLDEVVIMATMFTKAKSVPVLVLPLYGGLPVDAQDRIMCGFLPSSIICFIFTTSIAETSVTVPQVATVIDLGLQKISVYLPSRMSTVLRLVQASDSQRQQRAGRAGRVREGLCLSVHWPLVGPRRIPVQKDGYLQIQRSDLARLLLRLRLMGIRLETLQLPDPPDPSAIESFLTQLRENGALTEWNPNVSCTNEVTEEGRRFARLPIGVSLARAFFDLAGEGYAVYAAAAVACVATGVEMLWWGSGLESKERRELSSRHGLWFSGDSDVTTLTDLFLDWFSKGFSKSASNEFALNYRVAVTAREIFTSVLSYGVDIAVSTSASYLERVERAASLLAFDREKARAITTQRLIAVCKQQKHTATLCGAISDASGFVHFLYTSDSHPNECFSLTRPGLTLQTFTQSCIHCTIVFFDKLYISECELKALEKKKISQPTQRVNRSPRYIGYISMSIGLPMEGGEDMLSIWQLQRMNDTLFDVLSLDEFRTFPVVVNRTIFKLFNSIFPCWENRMLPITPPSSILITEVSGKDNKDNIDSDKLKVGFARKTTTTTTLPINEIWLLGNMHDINGMTHMFIRLVWVMTSQMHPRYSIIPDVPSHSQALLLRPDCSIDHLHLAQEDGLGSAWPLFIEYTNKPSFGILLGRLPLHSGPAGWPRFTVDLHSSRHGIGVYFHNEDAYIMLAKNGVGSVEGEGIGNGSEKRFFSMIEVCFTSCDASMVVIEGAPNMLGLGLARSHKNGFYRAPLGCNNLGLIKQTLSLYNQRRGNMKVATRLNVYSSKAALSPEMGKTELIPPVLKEATTLFGDQVEVTRSWVNRASFGLHLTAWSKKDCPQVQLLEEAAAAMRNNLEWSHVGQYTVECAVKQYTCMTIPDNLLCPIQQALERFGILLKTIYTVPGPCRAHTGVESAIGTLKLESMSGAVLASAQSIVTAIIDPYVPILSPMAAAFLGPFFPASENLLTLTQQCAGQKGLHGCGVRLLRDDNGRQPRVYLHCIPENRETAARIINSLLLSRARESCLASFLHVSHRLFQGLAALRRHPNLNPCPDVPPSFRQRVPAPPTPPPINKPRLQLGSQGVGVESVAVKDYNTKSDWEEEGWNLHDSPFSQDSVNITTPTASTPTSPPPPPPVSTTILPMGVLALLRRLNQMGTLQTARKVWLHPVMASTPDEKEQGDNDESYLSKRVTDITVVCRKIDCKTVQAVIKEIQPLLNSHLPALLDACRKYRGTQVLKSTLIPDTCLYICSSIGGVGESMVRPYRLQCGHSLCVECHSVQVLTRVQSIERGQLVNISLQCSVCKQPFTPLDMHNSLAAQVGGQELWMKWCRAESMVYLRQKGKLYFLCPSIGCGRYMLRHNQPLVTRCLDCQAAVCRACALYEHPLVDCGGRKLSVVLLDGQKVCPGCEVVTEKSGGCNHMVCTICRTHWCWACRWNQDDHPGVGIYTHINDAQH